MKVIIGLGNPGAEYEHTRHNIGFRVVEALAARHDVVWHFQEKWHADLGEAGGVTYCKPQTYMNKSGEAIGPYLKYHRIGPNDCLVILDDVDLPFGTLRYRDSGGSAGHKGLTDIINHLGTEDIPRLRVGVGRGDTDTTDHVLGRFTPEEDEELPGIIERAVQETERHE